MRHGRGLDGKVAARGPFAGRGGRGAALVVAAALLLAACDGKREQAASADAVASHAAHAASVTQPDAVGAAAHAEHVGAPTEQSAPMTPTPAASAHAEHAGAAQAQDAAAHAGHAGHAEPVAEHADTVLAAGELPGTSLFHLTSAFTAQDGAEFKLAELRGHPSVVVMFYGDCTTACPLLVKSAQDIEAALPSDIAAGTQFVMVSFDTDRDTPDKLRAYADEKGLDKDRWHWLIGSPLLTRQLATLLGVQYRDGGNGVFAHSNLVTVLDADGVPTARLEGLGVDPEPALAAIRAAND
ncbi:MAG: SCO family protein [Trueperaceae bacterium]|nr:SCO family protein [Trueperaceae bacterium]MCC6309937.1 SCO family protein [Trueperaceae bacterium]MCW5820804.1 SCO family protein [Trueperaceae bacterium]